MVGAQGITVTLSHRRRAAEHRRSKPTQVFLRPGPCAAISSGCSHYGPNHQAGGNDLRTMCHGRRKEASCSWPRSPTPEPHPVRRLARPRVGPRNLPRTPIADARPPCSMRTRAPPRPPLDRSQDTSPVPPRPPRSRRRRPHRRTRSLHGTARERTRMRRTRGHCSRQRPQSSQVGNAS